ncbi:MAG TPA: decarboxylating 6-phosphogluconate dehydrogenase [Candidatus Saccharimonadales bacterium]|nr:decarboxylating 6-phosphogluconate dehydrogenase [Candidatus Saccharimonadales bacterium]
MKLGFIGLGKMGSRMALKLLLDKHQLVIWNRSEEAISNFKFQISNNKEAENNLKIAKDIQELVQTLEAPRVIWLMLPAGEATQNILDEVSKYVSSGDIVIDGGNAHFSDTQRRYEDFAKKGIKFLGIGVSGGIIAAQDGYPLMAGGDRSAYEHIVPILDSLSKPHGGHAYFGEGGAGHFVKMVHNGIEYGMMQAISEGFGVLEKSPYNLDLLKVAKLWQKGTIVSSFLIDRAKDALEKDATLDGLEGPVATSGEADWTIEQAEKEDVDAENIRQSLEFRKKTQSSENLQKSFVAKMLNALRKEFGGHEVKLD